MRRKPTAFFISIVGAVAATVIICLGAFACRATKLNFCAEYYFLYYSDYDNAQSANSMSVAVSDYGGAGYIFCYGGKYYVTVACYYSYEQADSVRASLKRQELDCKILEVEIDSPRISGAGNKNLYTGNLNTLDSLSHMAYDCANALDTGAMSQSSAKGVLKDIQKSLKTLIAKNPDNCFYEELIRLDTICDNISGGRLYAAELRTFQVAVCDTIVTLNIF